MLIREAWGTIAGIRFGRRVFSADFVATAAKFQSAGTEYLHYGHHHCWTTSREHFTETKRVPLNIPLKNSMGTHLFSSDMIWQQIALEIPGNWSTYINSRSPWGEPFLKSHWQSSPFLSDCWFEYFKTDIGDSDLQIKNVGGNTSDEHFPPVLTLAYAVWIAMFNWKYWVDTTPDIIGPRPAETWAES